MDFVKKMLKYQSVLRMERENILLIKQHNSNILPRGLLEDGRPAIQAFLETKKQDQENEQFPNIQNLIELQKESFQILKIMKSQQYLSND